MPPLHQKKNTPITIEEQLEKDNIKKDN